MVDTSSLSPATVAAPEPDEGVILPRVRGKHVTSSVFTILHFSALIIPSICEVI